MEYREKTPAEKINEAEAWEELERKDSEERMMNPVQNSAQGKTRDKVAKKVGVSGETYRNGKKVKEIAVRIDR